jgi:tetratricopeptide (TPR) repeat protein
MAARWVRFLGIGIAVLMLAGCSSPEERFSEHMSRGDQYFENEKWSEARIEYWNALKIDPDYAEAHFKMAEALMRLNQFRDARWEYQESIRLAPDELAWRIKLAELLILFNANDDGLEQIATVLEREPENVEALVLRGIALAREGQTEEALAEIDTALELDPRNERALRLRARALESRGENERAEAAYAALIEAQPTTSNHIWFALYWASQGKLVKALAEYQSAVHAAESQEERTRARRVLAAFHASRGDIDSAEKVLLEAREEAPDDSQLALTLARLYAAQGEFERAEEMLKERVRQQPENAEPLLVLADFYRRSGDRERALKTTEQALEVQPTYEAALLQKAEYLIEQTDDPARQRAGRKLIDDVLAENPNNISGLLTLGKALLLGRHYEEAAVKLRRVLDEQPSSQGHVLLGVAYIGMGQLELGRSELLRATQLDPDNYTARSELAALYLRTGERELAAETARKGLEQRGDDPRLLLIIAEAETGLGNNEKALAALDRVSVDHVEYSERYRAAVGRLYRRLEKPELAREHLEAALEGGPVNATVIRELVSVDLETKDPERALERLNRVIEQAPDNGALYALRGMIYLGFRQGTQLTKAKEAENDLRRAIELDPAHIEAYGLLASLYRATGRMGEAITTFERARDARPEDPRVHLLVGTLYEQSGRTEEAIQEYEQVLRLEPNQPIAKNNLAWLLADTASDDPEQLDRALELAQDAREILPGNANVADTLGWVMLKKDIPTGAIPLFQEAIGGYEVGDPNRSVVRLHLARAYVSAGKQEKAIEELELALRESERFPNRREAEALLTELRAS